MKKIFLFLASLLFALPIADARAETSSPEASLRQGMVLMSDDIDDGSTLSMDHVYDGFGCTGANISPHLIWEGAPEGTKSFGLSVYDPDAPTGSGWWHWQVFNIPAETAEISRGASMSQTMPAGAVEAFSDYDAQGFGGACPPKGDDPHRYIFTLFALDVETLPLDANTGQAKIGYHLNAHALAKASFTARYGH